MWGATGACASSACRLADNKQLAAIEDFSVEEVGDGG